jgi:hypothetical protein
MGSQMQVRPAHSARTVDRARSGLLARARRHLPAILLTAGLVVHGVILVFYARDLWFWGDDWDFLFYRGTIPGIDLGLWAPHNEHWSTGPVVIMRILFELFGLNYLPYAMVTILIHLALSVVTYWLVTRTSGSAWAGLAAGWFVLFVGIGGENEIWDAAMNNTGALLLGLLALVAVERSKLSPRGVVVTWALLVLALMFSGTGISAVALVVMYVAAQYSLRMAALVASVPVAAFATWYLLVGHDASPFQRGIDESYYDIPQFVWVGLTRAAGNALGIPDAGAVIFIVLLVVVLVYDKVPDRCRHLAWAGIVAATVQLLLEAVSRLVFGPEIAATGRYAYFTIVLLAPAIGLCALALIQQVRGPRWLVGCLAAALLLGYAVRGEGEMRDVHTRQSAFQGIWKDRLLGIVASADAGQAPLAEEWTDGLNGMVRREPVLSDRIRAALPPEEPSDQGLIDAEMMFNIGVGTEEHGIFAPALIDLSHGFLTQAEQGPGCAEYQAVSGDPMIQLATGQGNEIGVTSDATSVTTELMRGDLVSQSRTWDVEPGPLYIGSTARDAVLRIHFNVGGSYVICKQ